MKNKFSAFSFLLIISLVAFLLGSLFTTRLIEEKIIHLAVDNIANITVSLNSTQDTTLVPKGFVNTPYETEELELTYKVVKKGMFTKKLLSASVDKVVDKDGNSFESYLTIKSPLSINIEYAEYLTFKVSMFTPMTQAEYEMIANKEILLTLNFWID